jgi:acyl-CoA dehydrogenase
LSAPIVKDAGARRPIPPFGAEHEELRATIRRWVESEVAPHVDEWDRAGEFPRELYERAGELGFLGLKYPEELGGQGGDYVHDAVWAEELAAAGAGGGVGAGLGAHTGIATPPIWKFGDPDQHERFLRPAIAGRRIGALAITEPGAGSDVAGIRTEARATDGGWVVNGAKTFITNGVRADFVVTACRTRPEGGHHGISFLLLERGMPGFEVARKLEKLGWQASFTDIEVPRENLLGPEHGGFYMVMANFQWERLLMAFGAVGAMRRLLEVTVAYALEREAFGRPIGRFQAIRHKFAECAVKLEASRALTLHALREFVRPEAERREAIARGEWTHPSVTAGLREVTEAKLLTQRAAVEVADECLQVHGGYGYMREYGIERALRDLRLGPIGGGTDEVMKEILGRQLGL